MLADARSRALVTNFAGQWLHLRNLDSITPDLRLFPDFDDNLRQAFRQETELFFESILREDRSVLDLLKADYTFLNERLAKHYGIPHVYGSRFRRVDARRRQPARRPAAPGQHPDGHLVRHAHVAGDPRQVGAREPARHAAAAAAARRAGAEGQHRRGSLSVRERLAEHRSNAACASCHNLMDPVGFALENFDAVGRWRRVEEGKPIDAAGGLARRQRSSPASPGSKQALLSRPGAVRRHADREAADLRARAAASSTTTRRRSARSSATRGRSDYRFSSLILGIVNSTPFQMRKSP